MTGEHDLIPVSSVDEIPPFASEAEEADFWATHGFAGALLESLGTVDDADLPPPRPRKERQSDGTP